MPPTHGTASHPPTCASRYSVVDQSDTETIAVQHIRFFDASEDKLSTIAEHLAVARTELPRPPCCPVHSGAKSGRTIKDLALTSPSAEPSSCHTAQLAHLDSLGSTAVGTALMVGTPVQSTVATSAALSLTSPRDAYPRRGGVRLSVRVTWLGQERQVADTSCRALGWLRSGGNRGGSGL